MITSFFLILKQLILLSNQHFIELLFVFLHLFSSELHQFFYLPIRFIDRYVRYAFIFTRHLSCCSCFVLFKTWIWSISGRECSFEFSSIFYHCFWIGRWIRFIGKSSLLLVSDPSLYSFDFEVIIVVIIYVFWF